MTDICYTQQSNARYPMFYSLNFDVDVDADINADAYAGTSAGALIDVNLDPLK